MLFRSSESESDIESESEEESSVSGSAQRTTDDDRSLTDQKRRICSQAGIPPKYSSTILTNPEISPNDILAQLAYNHSRKGKVKNPGYVTGMNLAKDPPEKAAAKWYNTTEWIIHCDHAHRAKLGLDFQSEPEGLDTLSDVTTRNAIQAAEVERKAKKFLRGDAA